MKKILQLLLILSFVFFLIFITIFPIEDSDIWFHLASGKWIWEHKVLATPDPFSWSVPNLPWTNLEWGIDLILYGVERLGGLNGVVIAKAVLITISFLILLLFQIRISGFSLWAFLILTIGVIASADRFMERVEHVGYFFLVLELGLLFSWRKKLYLESSKFGYPWIFPLPLIFFLWVNMHPTVVLGAGLFLLFIIGEFASWAMVKLSNLVISNRERYRVISRIIYKSTLFTKQLIASNVLSLRAIMLMGFIFLLAIATSFINPYKLEPYITALKVGGADIGSSGISAYLTGIIEYQSPFAPAHQEQIYTRAFLATLVLYWITMIVGWLKHGIRPSHVLILAAVTYLGLTRVRHINVFVLVGYLPVMMSLREYTRIRKRMDANERMNVIERIRKRFWSTISSLAYIRLKPRLPRLHSFAFAYNFVLLLYILGLVSASLYILQNGYQLGRVYRTFSLGQRPIFADRALKFLDEQNINGNLFNNYGMGGYIIYAGYPERKVFIDGRAHYPPELFLEHGDVNKSPDRAHEILDKYQIDYVMILHPEGEGKMLADYLSDDRKGWALIYWDQYYLVYVRRRPSQCEQNETGSPEVPSQTTLGVDCENLHNVISRYEYAYADPILLRRPEVLEQLGRGGKKALKPKVRTRGELERNLEIVPDNTRARVLLGGIMELISDLEEARKVYEDVVRRDPKFAMGHFLLGNIYRANSSECARQPGDLESIEANERMCELWEKAKQEFQKAFALDKTVSRPLVVLGTMEKEEGNLDEAIKLWTKATLIASTDPEAFYYLGILYSNEKYDKEKARFYLERYITLTSGDTIERERAEMILQRLQRE